MNEQPLEVEYDDLEAPIWPKVVGITSTVWGTLGLGCGLCGTALLSLPMIFEKEMSQEFPDGIPPTLAHPPVEIYLLALLGAVLAVYLITCGIVLLLRKPLARPLHLVYAVAALTIFVGSFWFNWRFQAELKQWNLDNPNTKWAQQQANGQKWKEIAGTSVGIVMGSGWPLFCLIWFGLVKRDSQEIARGVETLV